MERREMTGNRKQKHIGRKIGGVVAIMLGVSIIVAVSLCVIMFRYLVSNMQTERCVSGTNMLAYELSKFGNSGDKNELLDNLKDSLGCEFTIFEGDVRAYTTVIQDGERVVGTKLDAGIAETVLQQGEPYVGKAEILGEEYICSYVPTENYQGEINGLIFAGISNTSANEQSILAVEYSAGASAIIVVLCIIILAVYLRNRISAPLIKITQAARRLAEGQLGLAEKEEIKIGVRSNDEIGELGRIFEETILRMRSYIGEIADLLGAIANGDLTSEVKQHYVGEFASIKQSLEGIEDKLNHTMGQIWESAERVSSGSEQMSASAQILAQGATEQASAVEELSATINMISEDAKKTDLAAEEVDQAIGQAGGQLGVSMEYVEQLNTAMESISVSSDKISKIITAIEDIAFQTNILALNASVEAARAGSAGKGFVVVAEEVHNLAAKADEAAKATQDLIQESIVAVNEGSDMLAKVIESLGKTSEFAGNVTTKMAIVVEAVESQSTAISQITEGIGQISAVVQTNSATSQESASTSEELSEQAGTLNQMVSSFQLRQGSH